MLQIELDIDKDKVFSRVPRPRRPDDESDDDDDEKPKVDNTLILQKDCMLCPLHINKLIAVIERLGDKAQLKTILEGKIEDDFQTNSEYDF